MKIGLAYDSDTKLWSWVAGYRDEGVVRASGTAKSAIAAVTLSALKTLALSQIGLPAGAYEDLPHRGQMHGHFYCNLLLSTNQATKEG